jgi:uncharacterized protein YndB with AHSA1/START domain
MAKTTAARTAEIRVATTIAAPPHRVWRALVAETDAWWPANFRTMAGTKRFVVDARIGGLVYEDLGAGAGLVWYTVTGVVPGAELRLQGPVSADFGGPAVSMVAIRVADVEGGAQVTLTDCLVGRIDAASVAAIEGGWKVLIEGALKKYAERPQRRRP